jgi:hypothetical protein
MYALPKKAGQYYQDIVEIIAEHGGPKPVAPVVPIAATPFVAPEVDIFGIPLAPGPKEPNSLIDRYAKGEITLSDLPQFELKPGQSNVTGTERNIKGEIVKFKPADYREKKKKLPQPAENSYKSFITSAPIHAEIMKFGENEVLQKMQWNELEPIEQTSFLSTIKYMLEKKIRVDEIPELFIKKYKSWEKKGFPFLT